MPVGRGGAGNIEAQQREEHQSAQDLEAQRQTIDQNIAQVLAGETSNPPQDYAYSGRGGAGNLYSPKHLDTTGTFTSSSVTDFDQISTPMQQIQDTNGRRPSVVSIQQSSTPPVRRVGRGGAGNYEYGQTQAKSQEVEEQQRAQTKREEIQSAVEQSIDEQLILPPKARMPVAGVYRG